MKTYLSPYVRQPAPFSGREEPHPIARQIAEEEATHLREYWYVLRKRLWLVITLFLTTVLVAGVLVSVTTPIYVAETTLLIEPQIPHVLDIREVLSQPLGPEEYDYYKTQYEILRSQTLASRVIREQNLDKNNVFLSEENRFSAWPALRETGCLK